MTAASVTGDSAFADVERAFGATTLFAHDDATMRAQRDATCARAAELASQRRVRVVLLPGNGDGGDLAGAATDFWYTWLRDAVHARTHGAVELLLTNMPDPCVARECVWLPFARDRLRVDERTIVVGHSSGAVAALRLLERTRVAATVLVAACHTDLGDANERAAGYYARPWRYDEACANAGVAFVQYHSPSDPFIPIAEADHVARHARTDYRVLARRGHFTAARFDELLELLVELVERIDSGGGEAKDVQAAATAAAAAAEKDDETNSHHHDQHHHHQQHPQHPQHHHSSIDHADIMRAEGYTGHEKEIKDALSGVDAKADALPHADTTVSSSSSSSSSPLSGHKDAHDHAAVMKVEGYTGHEKEIKDALSGVDAKADALPHADTTASSSSSSSSPPLSGHKDAHDHAAVMKVEGYTGHEKEIKDALSGVNSTGDALSQRDRS